MASLSRAQRVQDEAGGLVTGERACAIPMHRLLYFQFFFKFENDDDNRTFYCTT